MSLFLKRWLKLICLGAWLLLIIWFEDTSDWTEEKMRLAKRSFAVLMLIIVLGSIFFSLKATADEYQPTSLDKRVDRIEARQDRNFDEHVDIKQRLTNVEGSANRSEKLLERLIFGVIGLTFAVVGQLVLALFKYKLSDQRDNMLDLQDAFERKQDREDRGYR